MPGPWEKYQGTASATPQGPWTKYAAPDFAANPPAAAGPHVDMHKSFLLGPASDNADTPIKPQDVAKGMAQNAYDISAPNILNQVVKQHTGVDVAAKVGMHGAELKDIPQEAATTMIPILAGGMDVPEPTPVPRGSLAEGMKFARESPTTPGRLARLMKQGVKEIPGYGKVSRFVEAWKEPESTPAATPPAAPIPETDGVPWGSGGQGPLELRGKPIPRGSIATAMGRPPVYPGAPEPATPSEAFFQGRGLAEGGKPGVDPAAGLGKIPVRGAIAEKMREVTNAEPSPIAQTPAAQQSAAPPPAPIASPRPVARGTLSKMMDQELGNALGAKTLDPKVPLRGQLAARMPQQSESAAIPEGHIPVESSALRSYRYDPAAREFHAQYNSGNKVHIFGDVSPEEAQEFEAAPSKGKAMAVISKHVEVARIINGKRVSLKPTSR